MIARYPMVKAAKKALRLINTSGFNEEKQGNTESPATQSLLPELYQPLLVWITPLALRLRGFERRENSKGVFSVVQEWHCEMP